MKRKLYLVFFIFFIMLILLNIFCKGSSDFSVPTVENVNIQEYLGKWYEVARLPHRFERDLVNVTATYTLREDGYIKVLNQGYKFTPDGEHKSATAKAWVPDENKPGELKVQFFWPFKANYYIAALDDDYSYALVLSSSPNYMWILSRKPTLDDNIYNKLVDKANKIGIDTSELIKVKQRWN